jgi:hypothetical protein
MPPSALTRDGRVEPAGLPVGGDQQRDLGAPCGQQRDGAPAGEVDVVGVGGHDQHATRVQGRDHGSSSSAGERTLGWSRAVVPGGQVSASTSPFLRTCQQLWAVLLVGVLALAAVVTFLAPSHATLPAVLPAALAAAIGAAGVVGVLALERLFAASPPADDGAALAEYRTRLVLQAVVAEATSRSPPSSRSCSGRRGWRRWEGRSPPRRCCSPVRVRPGSGGSMPRGPPPAPLPRWWWRGRHPPGPRDPPRNREPTDRDSTSPRPNPDRSDPTDDEELRCPPPTTRSCWSPSGVRRRSTR